MLFPHHFNSSLGRIKIKLVILLPILSFTCVIFDSIRKLPSIRIIASPLLLRHNSSILAPIKTWKVESTLVVRRRSSLGLWILTTSSFGLLFVKVIDIHNAVLHKHKMSILIWSLLRLSFFNSFIQEINSFFILFFQFGFDAFVLDILESIHLEIVVSVFYLRSELVRVVLILAAVEHLGLVVISYCMLEAVVVCALLCCLPHFGELDVVFIENDLLNIVGWHLSHK